MEFNLKTPMSKETIKKLHIGDIIYVTGKMFTARDEAHKIMLETDEKKLPFNPKDMVLFHCGPLMKKDKGKWQAVSAGPTTSSRMEIFEDKFIERFRTNLIIGKGGMGERTQRALEKYSSIYTSYTGGAGALAAERIYEVEDVFWFDELGMPEAVWIFKVKDFGPLVVSMDSYGTSIYK